MTCMLMAIIKNTTANTGKNMD